MQHLLISRVLCGTKYAIFVVLVVKQKTPKPWLKLWHNKHFYYSDNYNNNTNYCITIMITITISIMITILAADGNIPFILKVCCSFHVCFFKCFCSLKQDGFILYVNAFSFISWGKKMLWKLFQQYCSSVLSL